MIVTRQRRKPFPWRRLILPVIALGLVAFAAVWPPSRNYIANGPLAPVWRLAGPVASGIAEPFHYAEQNKIITERNVQIGQLKQQLADAQAKADAKDKALSSAKAQLQQMQLQASQAASQPASTSAPASNSNSNSAGFAANASSNTANDLAANPTPDERRTAADWASMEPENAAKVVQKLPIDYSARILALMSPDAVGSILDALPATYAARLTQDHPELKK